MPSPPHDVPNALGQPFANQRAVALLPWDAERDLGDGEELGELARTLGIHVAGHISLARWHGPGAATFLGPGRTREIAERIAAGRIDDLTDLDAGGEAPSNPVAVDLVLVEAHLSPRQHAHLEEAFGLPVLDRTAIILHIFEQRAQTREARLEVELARLRYDLPRVRASADAGDDRRGGGGRGERGHTNVQLAKMRIRNRIATIQQELVALQRRDDARRQQRADVFTVALVGYTNVGKSTLMRQLTGADVLAEDKLFATIGTTVRRLHPEVQPPVLVGDTVGFVRDLPHELVASFHSTLDQARTASLLLVVVDPSNPAWESQFHTVADVLDGVEETAREQAVQEHLEREHALREAEALAHRPADDDDETDRAIVWLPDSDVLDRFVEPVAPNPPRPFRDLDPDELPFPERILVFNKIDRLHRLKLEFLRDKHPDAVFVSALDADSVRDLRERILEERDRELEEVEIEIPWKRGGLLSTIRGNARVVDERHDEHGTTLVVRARPEDIAQWTAELGASYH